MGGRIAGGRGAGSLALAVSDASPLIALERIGRLDLVADVFGTVIIPPAVAGEVGAPITGLNWIEQRQPSQPLDPRVVAASLGRGETEAISLALDLRGDRIVLDDRLARTLAAVLGLPVAGLLGMLIAAKQRAMLPTIRPVVDHLIRNGFRVSPIVYRSLLASVGETP